MNRSRFHLQSHLDQLYTSQPRRLAFRADTPDVFTRWQQTARTEVAGMLGIVGREIPAPVKAERLEVID